MKSLMAFASGVGVLFSVSSVYATDYLKLEPEKRPSVFQKLPKAELHLHLGGAFPLSYLLSIANDHQKELLRSQFEQVASGVDYSQAFHFFNSVNQIINTEEKLKKGTEALCQFLKEDGVEYVEIRTGLKNLGKGQEAYLQAVLEGMRVCEADGIKAYLLLSLQRASSHAQAELTVDLALDYRDQGVIGIDISGDSTQGKIENIIFEISRAKEKGLFLALHMGESPQEKNQRSLLEILRPDRIGHGVHLSPEAKEWIKLNKTPVEVCLSSGVEVKMVQNHHEHPGIELYREGHPIALCTDDPMMFRTTLSQELEIFKKAAAVTDEQVKELVQKFREYGFDRLSTKAADRPHNPETPHSSRE